MSCRAIIFDLDGVICSTDQYHYLAWKTLADRLGIFFDRKINDRLRGVSRMQSLEIILEQSDKAYTQAETEALCSEKNACYRAFLSQMSPNDLDKDVKNTLNALRAGGLVLAIGSSSRNAPYILERLGLGDYFDAVADGSQIHRSKPDPEVFLLAAKKLDLLPNDCLVVEDAFAGIDAAIAGGFHTAGIGEAANHSLVEYRLNTICDLLSICLPLSPAP